MASRVSATVCVKRFMYVEDARQICKDRDMWRPFSLPTPLGPGPDICACVCVCAEFTAK